jgi:hypothetical protein
MGADKVHEEASETDAVNGVVLVDGPDNVSVLFTPAAAEATAERLTRSAGQARGQQPAAAPKFRETDDDTLLELYDAARTAGEHHRCEMISDELEWRGIVAPPCGDTASDPSAG